MKKIILTSVIFLAAITGAMAMNYDQAREQAAFLTDKMAYELNMTDEQYDAAYEINLDYLMSVNDVDDVYADNWQERNYELEQLLQDWQWQSFCAASYFYRPLYWGSGSWHFGVYARYPQRDFYYYDRPASYFQYHGTPRSQGPRFSGGRAMSRNNGPMMRRSNTPQMRSPNGGRTFTMARRKNEGRMGGMRGNSGMGMRSSGMQRGNGSMGGMRQSSTRSTVGSQSRGFRPEMRTRSTNTFMGGSQRGNGGPGGGQHIGGGQHGNGGNGGHGGGGERRR